MGRDDRREGLLVHERCDEVHHHRCRPGVELAGRFVGDQHRGPVGQGARDADALALTAGELVGSLSGVLGQPDALEQLLDPRRALGDRRADQPQRDLDVLGGGERRQQREGLEDEAELTPAQLDEVALACRRELDVSQPDPPAGRVVQATRGC